MRVLVACEESQVVTKAFRARGFEAYSCDIIDCSGGKPEWHIKGDALEQLDKGWDLMIAHPPCTYLSNAGARFLYPNGVLNKERLEKGLEAKDFFMRLYNANIPYVCVENPTPSRVYELPQYTQIIQPYEYGHPYKKATRLWLKGLPNLEPTNIVTERQSSKVPGNWFNKGGSDRQRNRAKTFQGIADAMAEQWGNFLLAKQREKVSVLQEELELARHEIAEAHRAHENAEAAWEFEREDLQSEIFNLEQRIEHLEGYLDDTELYQIVEGITARAKHNRLNGRAETSGQAKTD